MRRAEELRLFVADSDIFVEKISISSGVVSLNEIYALGETSPLELGKNLLGVAEERVKLANNRGGDRVVDSSELYDLRDKSGKILLADYDLSSLQVLWTVLENEDFEVYTADNGREALRVAREYRPDLIVSEIMLPEMDGFLVREILMNSTKEKDILFFIVSHQKNEDSVQQALELGVEHYLRKPFMLSELVGLIKRRVKRGENG